MVVSIRRSSTTGIAPSFQATAELRDKLYRIAHICAISPYTGSRVNIGVEPVRPLLWLFWLL
jgi:hypothetical protein